MPTMIAFGTERKSRKRWIRSGKVRAQVTALAIVALSTGLVTIQPFAGADEAASHVLMVSSSADRSNAAPLDGSARAGNMYVFVAPETAVKKATFFVDDVQMRRTPFVVERQAPWDLAGTNQKLGTAKPFDTRSLADGIHNLTVRLDLQGGLRRVFTSTFTVGNQVNYDLAYSTSADRSNPKPLSGASLSGSVYVFMTPPTDVSKMSFTLDGSVVQNENSAPFDFAGGEVATANPYNTAQLDAGTHEIGAHLTLSSGLNHSIAARFSVANTSTTTTAAPTTTTTAASTTTTTATAAPASTTTTTPPAPAPAVSAWPDASNTGPIGAGLGYADLRDSGSIDVTQNGAVIDKVDVDGRIRVYADNVTIKRSRIRHNSAYGIQVMSGADNLVVEYVEIIGNSNTATANIGVDRYTLRHSNLWGAVDGAKAENDVVIENSYIHSLRKFSGTHNDGIQNSGGDGVNGPVIIRGNAIYGPYQTSTSAIIAQTNIGPIDGMIIENNFLYGGSYTVYLKDKGSGNGPPTNSYIRNNVFARGTSGVYRVSGDDSIKTAISASSTVSIYGNRWDDGSSM